MTKELEQLNFDDLMCDLASVIEQYGARHVLAQFKERYPNHMNELAIQFHHRENKQVAALLRPN